MLKLIMIAVICGLMIPRAGSAQSFTFEEFTAAQDLRQEALEAYRAGDLDTAAAAFARAAAFRPDHFGIWRNLAVVEAERGNQAAAVKAFEHVASLRVVLDADARGHFEALPDSDAKRAAAYEFERSARRMGNVGILDIDIPDSIRLVEDLEYDPAIGRLYLSSVVNQKIHVWQDGEWAELLDLGGIGLGSPLGMALDVARQRLWVSFGNVEPTPDPDEQGRSGILGIDVLTGDIRERLIPSAAPGTAINDVTVHPDGRVFAADGRHGVIYVASGNQIQVLLDSPAIVSAQGLALNGNADTLYVADYARGIHRIDLESGAHAFMPPPPNRSLIGIDGLTYFFGDLIAMRNGSNPQRYIALHLSDDGSTIEQVRSLAANLDSISDPTLLTRIEGQVWSVGVSGWRQFGKGGVRRTDIEPQPVRLISLKIDD